MWMPARASVPLGPKDSSASRTRPPAGPKMMAELSATGARSNGPPTDVAPLPAHPRTSAVPGMRMPLVPAQTRHSHRRHPKPCTPTPGTSGPGLDRLVLTAAISTRQRGTESDRGKPQGKSKSALIRFPLRRCPSRASRPVAHEPRRGHFHRRHLRTNR